MASSSSSGLTFKLHPLVIVNISDHYTRLKSQSQPPPPHNHRNGGESTTTTTTCPPPPPPPRVFGCVIGVQRGRTVEIFNSFELLYDPSLHSLDRSFLEKKQELYKKVFPNFYILGWYSTGSEAEESDMHIHKAGSQFCAFVRYHLFVGSGGCEINQYAVSISSGMAKIQLSMRIYDIYYCNMQGSAKVCAGGLVYEARVRVLILIRYGYVDTVKSKKSKGVCIGLSEVMASAGKSQLLSFMDELIPTIRTTLCDSMPEVRESAGLAFSTLYKSAGLQTSDEIVPTLLHALEDDETSDTALDGLKQILKAFNAHALGALAEVVGPGLDFHLSTVVPALLTTMDDDNMEVQNLAKKAAETVVLIIDEKGIG